MTDKSCIYVFDKAYVDYKKFDKFTVDKKYFVTRLKDNAIVTDTENFKITYTNNKLLDDKTKIVYDKVAFLGFQYINKTKKTCRIIKITYTKEKDIIFVTNIFDLSSEKIAWLYKKVGKFNLWVILCLLGVSG